MTDRGLPRLRLAAFLLASAALVLISATPAPAQQRAARGGESAGELHWWPVRKNIWMLVGAGTNIAASG